MSNHTETLIEKLLQEDDKSDVVGLLKSIAKQATSVAAFMEHAAVKNGGALTDLLTGKEAGYKSYLRDVLKELNTFGEEVQNVGLG